MVLPEHERPHRPRYERDPRGLRVGGDLGALGDAIEHLAGGGPHLTVGPQERERVRGRCGQRGVLGPCLTQGCRHAHPSRVVLDQQAGGSGAQSHADSVLKTDEIVNYDVNIVLDMLPGPVDQAPHTDRRARRRTQTRAKLTEAARTLFARQGVECTRINEITDEADVGFGSFYNHFASKEQIAETVLAETIAAQGAAVEAMTCDVEDPAEVVAIAHRYFVRLARTDPDWGWLLVRLDLSHDITRAALGPFAQRDLQRGIDTGRFEVPHKAIALLATGGALVAVMRAVLDGNAPKNADRLHAAGVLRLFGLTPQDAAEVAARPMPPVRSRRVTPRPGEQRAREDSDVWVARSSGAAGGVLAE